MNESQQKQGQTRLLLNIVMIVLETIYSFILKHDRVVSLQAKRFIQQQTTIKMNSYIPYFDFYIQFTDKGILFDLKAPEQAIDLSVSSTLLDFIQVFVFGNKRSMKKLRLEGDETLKDEFRDLVLHLTAPKLLSDWKTWLSNPDEHHAEVSQKRIAPLLEKIDQQRAKINVLQLDVKQHHVQAKKIKRNYKRLQLAFYVISVLFTLLILYNVWLIF